MTNIANPAAFNARTEKFIPCGYYDQLNKGIAASHSIFNYSNFLIFTQMHNSKILQSKKLLVLDEGHQIESQIVDQIGITISKKTLQRYIANLSFREYQI